MTIHCDRIRARAAQTGGIAVLKINRKNAKSPQRTDFNAAAQFGSRDALLFSGASNCKEKRYVALHTETGFSEETSYEQGD